MPLFAYKGRTSRGDLVTGRIDGETAESVAARLFATGVTPVDISSASDENAASPRNLARTLGLGRVKTADLVLFSRQMYTITKSGIPLLRGLRGLVSSTHNAILRETL